MNKEKKVSLGIACIILLGITAWVIWPEQVLAEAMQGQDMHQMHQCPQKENAASLKIAHVQHIPALSLSIEKAILAVKAGDDAIALSELQKAQSLIDAIKKAVAQQIQPKFVNTKCPIMGGTIDPEKTTSGLTRQFKGQTIAFCCGNCPGVWDKLSDEEKETKLSKVKSETAVHQNDH